MKFPELLKAKLLTGGAFAVMATALTVLAPVLWRTIDNIKAEVEQLTVLESTLSAQQRQIDSLSTALQSDVSEIKLLIADTRKEFLAQDGTQNTVSLALLDTKFIALENRLDSISVGSTNAVNHNALENAVQAAENRLTQRFNVQIGGMINGAVEEALKNASPQTVTASAGDIPIATVRQIHIVEGECVYLPSFGDRFSLRLYQGVEICMEPSQLTARFTEVRQFNTMRWEIIGQGASTCSNNRTCYFGDQERDGFRYRIKQEDEFERDGIFYRVYNFEKLS